MTGTGGSTGGRVPPTGYTGAGYPPSARGWSARTDRVVLGVEHPDAVDEGGAAVGAQPLHQRRERVREVVAAGPSEEREPADHRDGSIGRASDRAA